MLLLTKGLEIRVRAVTDQNQTGAAERQPIEVLLGCYLAQIHRVASCLWCDFQCVRTAQLSAKGCSDSGSVALVCTGNVAWFALKLYSLARVLKGSPSMGEKA